MFKMFYVVFLLSSGDVAGHPDRMTEAECVEYGSNYQNAYCMPVKFFDAIVEAKAKAIGGGL